MILDDRLTGVEREREAVIAALQAEHAHTLDLLVQERDDLATLRREVDEGRARRARRRGAMVTP